jgi:hypothetical protein
MAVNYCGILTLEKVGLELLRYFTAVLFYNIGPWAQCYKTLYRGKLPPFHGNTIILCYIAILPW